MLHTMMQACKETNMTYQALKFYCNQGLVPNVKRDKNNRRVFDDREMKEYLSLCLMGESTIPQRKEMLARKQEELRRSIRELEDSMAYIDWKQNFYDEVLSGERPYESNVICEKE